MKTSDRKRLKELHETLEKAQAELLEIELELRDAIEAKSDKWREGEKGEEAESERNYVEEAANNVEAAMDSLANIAGLFA